MSPILLLILAVASIGIFVNKLSIKSTLEIQHKLESMNLEQITTYIKSNPNQFQFSTGRAQTIMSVINLSALVYFTQLAIRTHIGILLITYSGIVVFAAAAIFWVKSLYDIAKATYRTLHNYTQPSSKVKPLKSSVDSFAMLFVDRTIDLLPSLYFLYLTLALWLNIHF